MQYRTLHLAVSSGNFAGDQAAGSEPPGDVNLHPVEARILGSLIEKQITTPDYYPLSLNALLNACNQKSNRNPVVSYTEETILQGLELLRQKKLALVVKASDSRVLKYKHTFPEALQLNPPEVALLCVLLLRGPQTVGELRERTGRMHEFESLAAVESSLQTLVEREEPLVVKLPLQSGTKEPRYAHLLSGPVSATPPETGSAAEPDVPLSAAREDRIAAVEREVAELRDELHRLQQQFNDFRTQCE